MIPPKKIYLYPDVGNRNLVKTWFEQQMTKDCLPDFDQLSEVTWCKDRIHDNDVAYFSEEHIRAVANELYNNGDAFIAKLNGKSFSEYLKGASDD